MRSGFCLAAVAWMLVGGCSLSSHANDTDAAAVMDAATMADAGPQTEIVGVVTADQECIINPDSAFLLTGLFDVSDTVACNASYSLALLIHNFIPAADAPDGFVGTAPNALHFTDATVSLLVDGSLVRTRSLPNPFHVTTFATVAPAQNGEPGKGVALVEAIPSAYRTALTELGTLHARVIAEVTLTATTVNGVTVESDTFRFPIELCVGCLQRCESELRPEEIDGLSSGQCRDNAGADGRVCIDSGC